VSTGAAEATAAREVAPRPGRRLRRHERRHERRPELRRLARRDDLLARLAELHHIRALLEDTAVVVSGGWIQGAWLAVLDPQGRQHDLTAPHLHLATGRPVVGACLVGGIVLAAGGPATAHSQLVQRTLDLTWHTLHEDQREPVRWCPSPDVRSAHVRDLTRWNDHPTRTSDDVLALLGSAVAAAGAQIESRRQGLLTT
jgi:hypothetical protein